MTQRLFKGFVVALLAASILAGCGGSDDKGSDSSGGAAGLPPVAEKDWVDQTGKSSVVVEARDNVFVPENIAVSPGTKIVFENKGRNPHNVIPANKDEFEEIPVSKLQPGDSATVIIDDDGEFPYYCSLHGTAKVGMKGRIKVSKD